MLDSRFEFIKEITKCVAKQLSMTILLGLVLNLIKHF